MVKIFFALWIFCLMSCASTRYYVVRHAEKETAAPNMSSDVELSAAGRERATRLLQLLQDKSIRHIFSTNTKRTTATVKPLSDATSVPVQIYNPGDTGLVQQVKSLSGNVLIVGHSNTVDDIVNRFMNASLVQDLPDSAYNNLFVIQKRGSRYRLLRNTYGD